MKKLLALSVLALGLAACTGAETREETPELKDRFVYENMNGHGEAEDVFGYIIWENKRAAYTQYQIGFTLCTCRPEHENTRSMAYVEVNNDGTVRDFRFDYFGDSSWAEDIMNDEKFIEEKIIGANLSTVEEMAGVDYVAGATVTTDNITRMLIGLLGNR